MYIHAQIAHSLEEIFTTHKKNWQTDKKKVSAVTYFGVDFYLLNFSLLHARLMSSWVCATEYGLFFLTEVGNLARMVFSRKHQCLQAKWEQQEVTSCATLRSLVIKVNCTVWISKAEWNWLITALTLIFQRYSNIFFLNYWIIYTREIMRHLVWDRP